jgi:uncharacterized protein with HEPN domain
MQDPDANRIRHMLDACLEALEFSKGKTRSDLEKDRKLVLSLVKEVEIICEAASKITPEIKNSHPEIPWQDMALMRNRLIHVYFDVDLGVVWETIQKDLPDLKRKLLAIQNPDSPTAQEPPAVYFVEGPMRKSPFVEATSRNERSGSAGPKGKKARRGKPKKVKPRKRK